MRGDCLLKAHDIINGERLDNYGKPENNFKLIAKFWSEYKGVDFTDVDVAMMMLLLKVARIKTGCGTMDSFVDAAGYVGLAADLLNDCETASR